MQTLRKLATLLLFPLLSPTAAGGEPDAGVNECARLSARIAKRKHFLEIREQERIHFPATPTFSPYCESHPTDDDCQLLVDQHQQDLSRDVSALEMGEDGKTPVTDPVLVPLYRKRRELHCPRTK
ncbi:MAG: hypothetical protein ACYDCL_00130 [Myxococcales bacterium]